MSRSLNTVTETPEVLTGHTELICSTDIERLVTGREVALQQIKALMAQLQEIGSLIFSIGGGKLEDWAVQPGHRYGCHLTLEQDKGLAAITRQIDRKLWQDLMNRSGMLSLMDAQARDQWYRVWRVKTCPLSMKKASIARLSSYTMIRGRCLSVVSSTFSSHFPGITRPTILVASVRKSSSVIWSATTSGGLL